MNDYHYSAADFEIREAENGVSVVSGTIMRYGDINTVPWGTEEVTPGAFGDISKAHIEVNRRHIQDQVVASTGSGVKLFDDETRLGAEVPIPDTRLGRDVLDEIKAGLITGFSMEMRAVDQRLTDNYRHRTISRLNWSGFGMVGRPAYPDSTLESRDWRPYLLSLGYKLPEEEGEDRSKPAPEPVS